MNSSLVVSLIAAFGLGSLLTAVAQFWLARGARLEERNFEERKVAYIGLLEAYHMAAIEGTDAAAKKLRIGKCAVNLLRQRVFAILLSG